MNRRMPWLWPPRALELANETAHTRYPYERDCVRAHWLLGAAHRANDDLAEGIKLRIMSRLPRSHDHELVVLQSFRPMNRAGDSAKRQVGRSPASLNSTRCLPRPSGDRHVNQSRGQLALHTYDSPRRDRYHSISVTTTPSNNKATTLYNREATNKASAPHAAQKA
jgi:hypothetical protein